MNGHGFSFRVTPITNEMDVADAFPEVSMLMPSSFTVVIEDHGPLARAECISDYCGWDFVGKAADVRSKAKQHKAKPHLNREFMSRPE